MKTINRIWLITGVSGGLGKAIAREIYLNGDVVIGTVRKKEDQQLFEQEFPDRGHALILDLLQPRTIPALIDNVIQKFGRIDRLINNAGYGLFGFVEEMEEEQVLAQLTVNFLSVWKLTQAVLQHMRKQKSGHIIQISSRLGIVAAAGNGMYAAGKFALEGMSEALAEEVKPFGIHVSLVEPGPLRTGFFGQSISFGTHQISDYKPHLQDMRDRAAANNGKQDGDPAKAAKVIVDITNLQNPPFRLPLTKATIDALKSKADSYQNTVKEWEETASSIAF